MAPFVLTGKQILQEMCRDGASWDELLSEELRPRWERWRDVLPELVNVKIPRCFQPEKFGRLKKRELHHFSDASTTGYGQCSYMRLIDDENNVHCSLVMGKARVTPLRVITVPRVELQAAMVSVKISNLLHQELEYENVSEYFWTDSKVVLGYIGNGAKRFHVYVANRVQRIKEATEPNQWHYVATEKNPADCASRGLNATELISSSWFSGPSFLWERELPKEETDHGELFQNDPEVRQAAVLVAGTQEVSMLKRLEHFSDLSRAVKGIAVLQRFLSRRNDNRKQCTWEEDKERARQTIIKMVQYEAFAEEISLLKSGPNDETMREWSQIYKLDPFLDNDGILRVGGRLGRSVSLHYEVKHPMILPRKGHVTHLVIKHCHEKVAHQGRGKISMKC